MFTGPWGGKILCPGLVGFIPVKCGVEQLCTDEKYSPFCPAQSPHSLWLGVPLGPVDRYGLLLKTTALLRWWMRTLGPVLWIYVALLWACTVNLHVCLWQAIIHTHWVISTQIKLSHCCGLGIFYSFFSAMAILVWSRPAFVAIRESFYSTVEPWLFTTALSAHRWTYCGQ